MALLALNGLNTRAVIKALLLLRGPISKPSLKKISEAHKLL